MKSKENEFGPTIPPNIFIVPQNNIINTTNNNNNNINNNNANANGQHHGTTDSLNDETPSPLTVGGYASSGDLDEEAASLRPIIMADHRRRSGSGGPKLFKPRGSPRPNGQRKYATQPERTPSARGMTRPEQLIQQECRLKRQNSDPSPGLKRKPKLEIFPPPSPSPNHNSTVDLYMQTVYPCNVDDDLLKVPLRCGVSPSVGSFQSDPESCLDGLQFQYANTYGEGEDDYDEPFSIAIKW